MIPTGPVPKPMLSLAGFLTRWRDERHAAIPVAPDLLYHYTDSTGLMGIFRSKELWATDALYTNDRTEVFHSLWMLTRFIEEEKKDRQTDIATDMMLIAAEEFYAIVQVYAMSFCKNGDLLSQWRGYGRVDGYALGLDSSLLKKMTNNDVMLAPVLYDGAEQEQLIRYLIERLREMFKDADPGEYDKQRRRLGAFMFAQPFSFSRSNIQECRVRRRG